MSAPLGEGAGDSGTATGSGQQAQQQGESGSEGQNLGDNGKKVLEATRSERNAMKAERDQAKADLEQAKAQLQQFQDRDLSDLQKAQKAATEAEAKLQTQSQAMGARLARSEFAAAAAKRNPDADISSVLDLVDLSRFVGKDGEPDIKAITDAVAKLVPESSNGDPTFTTGARKSPPAGADMNQLLRSAAGRS